MLCFAARPITNSRWVVMKVLGTTIRHASEARLTRIIHFEFALATEAADNVDFTAHLGHRHLGAGGGHWGADDPTADALGEGRGNEQGTARQQHAAEKRDEFASPHHSIPRRPFAERSVMEHREGSPTLA